MAASGYLAWGSLSRGNLAGCSGLPQFDCQQALSGRWSHWIFVPVAVPGFFAYATMLLAAAAIGPHSPCALHRIAWLTLAALAMLTTGAAMWFLGVMVFAGEKYCPWCLVVHANGLFSAALVLLAFRRTAGPSDALRALLRSSDQTVAEPRQLPLVRAGIIAAMGLAALIAGQWLGPSPQTHRVDTLSEEARSESALDAPPTKTSGEPAVTRAKPSAEAAPAYPVVPNGVTIAPGLVLPVPMARGSGRGCRSPTGPKSTRAAAGTPATIPAWATPAPRVVVEMIDYTCPDCREVYGHLKEAQKNAMDRSSRLWCCRCR